MQACECKRECGSTNRVGHLSPFASLDKTLPLDITLASIGGSTPSHITLASIGGSTPSHIILASIGGSPPSHITLATVRGSSPLHITPATRIATVRGSSSPRTRGSARASTRVGARGGSSPRTRGGAGGGARGGARGRRCRGDPRCLVPAVVSGLGTQPESGQQWGRCDTMCNGGVGVMRCATVGWV